MIRPFCTRLCRLLILLTSCCAFGGIRPSFMLDYSSWHATDIVVVTPLSDDGSFQVLESWKGDLHPGTIIAIPDLAPKPDSVPINWYPRDSFSPFKRWTEVPVVPPGSRIVVYLKDGSQAAESTGKSSRWVAANLFSDMKASAAWIYDGRAYGFVQMINPGPSVFVRLWYSTERNAGEVRREELSESSLKERTFDVLRLQQQIEAAVAIEDRKARAEALRSYADSKIYPAKNFVLEELGKSGEAALPTIRSMLDDPKFSKDDGTLIEQYAKAGGAAAGPELTSRLEADVKYWQAIGPTLPVGWWNLIDQNGIWAETHGYRDRYSQTIALIRSLDEIRYQPAIFAAAQLRDFWKSLPQLNDPSGLNQTANEADKLVKHLQPGNSERDER